MSEEREGGGAATAPVAPATYVPPVRPDPKKPTPEPLPRVMEPPKQKASVCKPSDRAPAGWKRFRIRGDSPGGNQAVRYILAKTRADAEAEYIAIMHLADEAAIRDKNNKPVLKLHVTPLPD